MELIALGYDELLPGQTVDLRGEDLADIAFVKTKDIKWLVGDERRNGATKYSQFSVGSRSFTIQDTHQDIIDLLMKQEDRMKIMKVRLTATEYIKDVTDPDTGDPTGEKIPVRSFKFVSLTTLDAAFSYLANEGKYAAEKAKYAPKSTLSQGDLDKAVAKAVNAGMASFADKWAARFGTAPVAAPVAQQAAPQNIEE